MNERAKQIEKLAPEETKVIRGTEENLKKKSVKKYPQKNVRRYHAFKARTGCYFKRNK